ncbi:MAG TPA: sigma-70 family RNA polymerase sigma factor [Terriglobales bacterium]|nr:sigma-70 family RNA polymerase sigma factor [Terriglobales bacterium]
MAAATLSACARELSAPCARAGAAEMAAAEAVAAAVRQHGRTLYRIAYLVLRDAADAEEVVQESFLRAWRQGPRWLKVERPQAWLARVAWRLALDRSRRRRAPSVAPPLALESVAAGVDAERQAAARQQLARVQALIAALPRRLRAPLLLSSLEELNSRQIAAILGVPAVTVRSRLQRARRMLRQRLERMR